MDARFEQTSRLKLALPARNGVSSMRLGLVCGLIAAAWSCVPIYDFIWPRATDRNQGGVGFFLILILAPAFMSVGAIIGTIFGKRLSKAR
jgi:hypothetical protein